MTSQLRFQTVFVALLAILRRLPGQRESPCGARKGRWTLALFVANPTTNTRNASMKPSETLLAHRAAIRAIVEAHRASNARVFGSVVHGSDTEDSDLDILIVAYPVSIAN